MQVDKDEWNNFVANSYGSPILQSYEWGDLKEAFGWEPIRIAIKKDGSIAAAVSILKRNIPYTGKSVFYAPRGPVLDFGNKELFDELMTAVKIETKKHNAIVLKIDPYMEEEDPRKQLFDSFTQNKKQVQPRTTVILDLKKSSDDLINSFESKTRYNIRLSEKKGVRVVENSTKEGMGIFYKIHQETSKRDVFLIQSERYYQKIQELLIERGLGKVFLAYVNDIPIAGVVIFAFGDRIWYMYGASSDAFRNLMPNHAIHWHVIKWAKEKGYKYYDLWGIPSSPNPDHPLYGVYRFKKGFNGALVKLAGVYDYIYSPFWYNLFDLSVKIYQNLRSLVKKGNISDSLGE